MIESVYYVIKRPQSIPMYDRITNSYQVLIDDEMVSVPKNLFDKLFTTIDAEQAEVEKQYLFNDIDSVINGGERKQEFINNMKDIIRSSRRIVSKDMMLAFLKQQLFKMGYPETPEAILVIEEIYAELEEEES